MQIVPDSINVPAVMEFIVNNAEFKRRDESYPHYSNAVKAYSQFNSWIMPEDLWEDLHGFIKLPDFTPHVAWRLVQVQRYDVGDYILPHMDAYDIHKLHLFVLTGDPADGITLMQDGKLKTYHDEAGAYNDWDCHSTGSFHWVNPVHSVRYSIIIGE